MAAGKSQALKMKGKPVPGSLDKERRKKMPYFAQNKI
jgi:hypothetical protein